MSDKPSDDDNTSSEQTESNKVNPWPSADEAIGMARKFFKDATKSINEICQDYKDKRQGDKDD